MIKLIICGAAGRMGKMIIACAQEAGDLEVAGAVDTAGHPDLGQDAGELAGCDRVGVELTDSLQTVIGKGDVMIDFSAADAAAANVDLAAGAGKAVVIGTTALSPEAEERIGEAAKKVACVYSPNMSVGVNLLFRLSGEVARALGEDYDVEIVEAHHRFKKDAPSGTAKKIAQEIAAGRERELDEIAIYGREGETGERTAGQVAIHAVRAGDIAGEHTVIFSNLGERLELVHRAHSRNTFARGALRAARFAAGAAPGLYSMIDVLEKKTSPPTEGVS